MPQSISDIRSDYRARVLNESDADPNPITQFDHWFSEAITAEIPDPNGMTLATATADGVPSARIVLLKGFDERGFVFFTNYLSRKGSELAENPHAALVFWWVELQRQVRIVGVVTRIDPAESDAYYASRPLESRLGAWASEQSRAIGSRSVLEERFAELQKEYPDGDIPRPPHWGGFRLAPTEIEFWQGRTSRLHDRLRYTLVEGIWGVERLSP